MIRKTFMILVCVATIALSGSAYAIPFTMTNFGSDSVSSISVNVTDISGGARISVDVSGGPIVGDITGVFFDLEQNVDSFSFTLDPDTLSFTALEGAVEKAPNNSNMNPFSFDVGVAIGDLGLTDDFQTVAFNVLATGLDATDFQRMGVRLQSVGLEGGDRGGSAKYVGTPGDSPAPVPEPTTMLLLGSGLLGLVGVRRRLKRNKIA